MQPHVHSEAEISAFEQMWGIILPEAYRSYLKTIGGGCSTRSRVDLLEDWSYHPEALPSDYLHRPFPHDGAWNDRSLITDAGWRSSYFSDDWVSGSISIRRTGCEGRDILIVSGALRGEVWHDDRACNGGGIFPIIEAHGDHLDFDAYISRASKNLG